MYLHQSSTPTEYITYAESAWMEFRLKVVYIGRPEYDNLIRVFGSPKVREATFRMKESNEKTKNINRL